MKGNLQKSEALIWSQASKLFLVWMIPIAYLKNIYLKKNEMKWNKKGEMNK